ncbi:hypothetical protein D5018_17355 [Parashewanella curva]|uniref:Uncharacterized protein n=1 Tax=Parashewanella curva TaxID=2338552 RepID=A0A3L8PSX1_9GAMM|nr:hypothetical protein [Parashewanella curva]RLV58446.1 hypothetical protein D5018_17355 [Parashewanella curva]
MALSHTPLISATTKPSYLSISYQNDTSTQRHSIFLDQGKVSSISNEEWSQFVACNQMKIEVTRNDNSIVEFQLSLRNKRCGYCEDVLILAEFHKISMTHDFEARFKSSDSRLAKALSSSLTEKLNEDTTLRPKVWSMQHQAVTSEGNIPRYPRTIRLYTAQERKKSKLEFAGTMIGVILCWPIVLATAHKVKY